MELSSPLESSLNSTGVLPDRGAFSRSPPPPLARSEVAARGAQLSSGSLSGSLLRQAHGLVNCGSPQELLVPRLEEETSAASYQVLLRGGSEDDVCAAHDEEDTQDQGAGGAATKTDDDDEAAATASGPINKTSTTTSVAVPYQARGAPPALIEAFMVYVASASGKPVAGSSPLVSPMSCASSDAVARAHRGGELEGSMLSPLSPNDPRGADVMSGNSDALATTTNTQPPHSCFAANSPFGRRSVALVSSQESCEAGAADTDNNDNEKDNEKDNEEAEVRPRHVADAVAASASSLPSPPRTQPALVSPWMASVAHAVGAGAGDGDLPHTSCRHACGDSPAFASHSSRHRRSNSGTKRTRCDAIHENGHEALEEVVAENRTTLPDGVVGSASSWSVLSRGVGVLTPLDEDDAAAAVAAFHTGRGATWFAHRPAAQPRSSSSPPSPLASHERHHESSAEADDVVRSSSDHAPWGSPEHTPPPPPTIHATVTPRLEASSGRSPPSRHSPLQAVPAKGLRTRMQPISGRRSRDTFDRIPSSSSSVLTGTPPLSPTLATSAAASPKPSGRGGAAGAAQRRLETPAVASTTTTKVAAATRPGPSNHTFERNASAEFIGEHYHALPLPGARCLHSTPSAGSHAPAAATGGVDSPCSFLSLTPTHPPPSDTQHSLSSPKHDARNTSITSGSVVEDGPEGRNALLSTVPPSAAVSAYKPPKASAATSQRLSSPSPPPLTTSLFGSALDITTATATATSNASDTPAGIVDPWQQQQQRGGDDRDSSVPAAHSPSPHAQRPTAATTTTTTTTAATPGGFYFTYGFSSATGWSAQVATQSSTQTHYDPHAAANSVAARRSRQPTTASPGNGSTYGRDVSYHNENESLASLTSPSHAMLGLFRPPQRVNSHLSSVGGYDSPLQSSLRRHHSGGIGGIGGGGGGGGRTLSGTTTGSMTAFIESGTGGADNDPYGAVSSSPVMYGQSSPMEPPLRRRRSARSVTSVASSMGAFFQHSRGASTLFVQHKDGTRYVTQAPQVPYVDPDTDPTSRDGRRHFADSRELSWSFIATATPTSTADSTYFSSSMASASLSAPPFQRVVVEGEEGEEEAVAAAPSKTPCANEEGKSSMDCGVLARAPHRSHFYTTDPRTGAKVPRYHRFLRRHRRHAPLPNANATTSSVAPPPHMDEDVVRHGTGDAQSLASGSRSGHPAPPASTAQGPQGHVPGALASVASHSYGTRTDSQQGSSQPAATLLLSGSTHTIVRLPDRQEMSGAMEAGAAPAGSELTSFFDVPTPMALSLSHMHVASPVVPKPCDPPSAVNEEEHGQGNEAAKEEEGPPCHHRHNELFHLSTASLFYYDDVDAEALPLIDHRLRKCLGAPLWYEDPTVVDLDESTAHIAAAARAQKPKAELRFFQTAPPDGVSHTDALPATRVTEEGNDNGSLAASASSSAFQLPDDGLFYVVDVDNRASHYRLEDYFIRCPHFRAKPVQSQAADALEEVEDNERNEREDAEEDVIEASVRLTREASGRREKPVAGAAALVASPASAPETATAAAPHMSNAPSPSRFLAASLSNASLSGWQEHSSSTPPPWSSLSFSALGGTAAGLAGAGAGTAGGAGSATPHISASTNASPPPPPPPPAVPRPTRGADSSAGVFSSLSVTQLGAGVIFDELPSLSRLSGTLDDPTSSTTCANGVAGGAAASLRDPQALSVTSPGQAALPARIALKDGGNENNKNTTSTNNNNNNNSHSADVSYALSDGNASPGQAALSRRARRATAVGTSGRAGDGPASPHATVPLSQQHQVPAALLSHRTPIGSSPPPPHQQQQQHDRRSSFAEHRNSLGSGLMMHSPLAYGLALPSRVAAASSTTALHQRERSSNRPLQMPDDHDVLIAATPTLTAATAPAMAPAPRHTHSVRHRPRGFVFPGEGTRSSAAARALLSGLVCIDLGGKLTYVDPRTATGAVRLLVDAALLQQQQLLQRQQDEVGQQRAQSGHHSGSPSALASPLLRTQPPNRPSSPAASPSPPSQSSSATPKLARQGIADGPQRREKKSRRLSKSSGSLVSQRDSPPPSASASASQQPSHTHNHGSPHHRYNDADDENEDEDEEDVCVLGARRRPSGPSHRAAARRPTQIGTDSGTTATATASSGVAARYPQAALVDGSLSPGDPRQGFRPMLPSFSGGQAQLLSSPSGSMSPVWAYGATAPAGASDSAAPPSLLAARARQRYGADTHADPAHRRLYDSVLSNSLRSNNSSTPIRATTKTAPRGATSRPAPAPPPAPATLTATTAAAATKTVAGHSVKATKPKVTKVKSKAATLSGPATSTHNRRVTPTSSSPSPPPQLQPQQQQQPTSAVSPAPTLSSTPSSPYSETKPVARRLLAASSDEPTPPLESSPVAQAEGQWSLDGGEPRRGGTGAASVGSSRPRNPSCFGFVVAVSRSPSSSGADDDDEAAGQRAVRTASLPLDRTPVNASTPQRCHERGCEVAAGKMVATSRAVFGAQSPILTPPARTLYQSVMGSARSVYSTEEVREVVRNDAQENQPCVRTSAFTSNTTTTSALVAGGSILVSRSSFRRRTSGCASKDDDVCDEVKAAAAGAAGGGGARTGDVSAQTSTLTTPKTTPLASTGVSSAMQEGESRFVLGRTRSNMAQEAAARYTAAARSVGRSPTSSHPTAPSAVNGDGPVGATVATTSTFALFAVRTPSSDALSD